MLIISSVASAQNNSTLSKEGLHGKVKVLLLTQYEVDDKFGKLIKGKISYVEKYFFDNRGYMKKLIIYGKDGNPREELRYYYNSKDELNKFTVSNVAQAKALEKRLGKAKNELEKEIIMLSEIDFFYYEDFFYKYDKKGNVIEDNLGTFDSKYLDFSTSMGEKNKYYYDNSNKIIKRELYGSANPNKIYLTWLNRRDSNGNLIEQIESSSYDYGIRERIVSNYNSNNELIKQKTYNHKGVVVENKSLEYLEYDVNKNWVKLIFYRNDNPLVITERDIKYYK